MTLERFSVLVDAYGADPDRWPVAERAEAIAFIGANPASARPIMGDAQALDARLDAYRLPPPPDLAPARIVAQLHRRLWRRWAGGVGAGLAAACAAGVAFGMAASYHATEEARTDALIAAVWGDQTGGLDEEKS